MVPDRWGVRGTASNTTIMPSSRRASPIESNRRPPLDTFYTIRNSVSPLDFIIVSIDRIVRDLGILSGKISSDIL